MVSALGNGVKGGKWFSLVDKGIRPTTLVTAGAKSRGIKGLRGWMARAWSGSRPARSSIFRNFMRISSTVAIAPRRSSAWIAPRRTHSGRQSGSDHRRPQPHASGLVRVFSSRDPVHVQHPRQLYPETATLNPAQAGEASGRGRTFEDHRRWPNVFFADRGLFTLKSALESARDSR